MRSLPRGMLAQHTGTEKGSVCIRHGASGELCPSGFLCLTGEQLAQAKGHHSGYYRDSHALHTPLVHPEWQLGIL